MKIQINQILLISFSVFLSLLLWLWVSAQERSEIVVSVPLQYRNLPKGFEIVGTRNLVTNLNIWVRGTTSTIRNLRPQEVTAWVDLGDAKAGAKNFEMAPDQVRVPYGFTVLRISPSSIPLRIEQITSRMVPVTVRLQGEPPVGFEVSETRVVPPMIEIRGPQSEVAQVRQVMTDSIDVSSINGIHEEMVHLGLENSALRLGEIKTVRVTLTVSEIKDVITLRHIPITVTGAQNVRFSPRMLRVDVLGPKRLLTQISEGDVTAVVEAEGLKSGVYELTPRIVFSEKLNKQVSVKDVTPLRVHVRIP